MTSQSPVQHAEALGHTMEWDPPFASSASRWTCKRCEAAVLQNRSHVYGSAIEKTCDQAKADLERVMGRA
ncbi:hypothetical protein FH608_046310 [Nonomuraea phyllanthi]|uniref:Uncharacterized protein n=1 Tax=Nonomuraea phyllanthi TaxID=2219224 RepID=A0A5C4V8U0_9ACTN|nr:hypothetical protein FH608_046310 [Nonomuraea phyllanthi]